MSKHECRSEPPARRLVESFSFSGSSIQHVHRAVWIWPVILSPRASRLRPYCSTPFSRLFGFFSSPQSVIGSSGFELSVKRSTIVIQNYQHTLPFSQIDPVNPGRQIQRKPLLVIPA